MGRGISLEDVKSRFDVTEDGYSYRTVDGKEVMLTIQDLHNLGRFYKFALSLEHNLWLKYKLSNEGRQV